MTKKISVFHGSAKNKMPTELALSHLSTSKNAAAERIEALFTGQCYTGITVDGNIEIIDPINHRSEKLTLRRHLTQFQEYLCTCKIYEFELEVLSPLRVEDLWEDDPIGSGGFDITAPSGLGLSERETVKQLFSPYVGVVYPELIWNHCTQSDIERIGKKYRSNRLFKRELKKRYDRARANGEQPGHYEVNEQVWLDLTFKFRAWAIENGYDALVYSNYKEGNGADCYVLLKENSKPKPVRSYKIDLEEYIKKVPERLDIQIAKMVEKANSGRLPTSLLWADLDPKLFWV